jgi:hypothetical protein
MRLKVFGGCTFVPGGKQVRAIVAASSALKVARAVGTSAHYIRGYWAVTANAEELSIALAKPGTVFYRPLDALRGPWKELARE